MRITIFLLITLFLVNSVGSQSLENEPVLSIPNVYNVSGVLKLPYADIDEPFDAWYDGKNNRSRIDYYGGTMKTYMRADLSEYGISRTVNPYTKDSVNIEAMCTQFNGTENSTITTQGVFPDLQGFKYIGQKEFEGKLCDVWENVTENESKVSTYRFWGTRQDSGTVIPVRYEMFGYNSLFGSHYDKYELIYYSFNALDSIDGMVFELEENLDCTSYTESDDAELSLMNPMKEFIHGNDAHVHVMFEDFKTKYNKNYANEIEHSQRKTNFLHNLRFVHSHNRASKSYRVALNHMADWGEDEASQLRGRKPDDTDQHDGLSFDPSDYNASNLPDMLDWRYYGAVTPVKDQAICGSCWSFGTTGTIEGAYFLKKKALSVLSEQALVDCTWNEGNHGCFGGEDFKSYRWIKEKGIPISYAYGPYLGINGRCHHQNISEKDLVYITDYVNVTSRNIEHLKLAMVNKGPISVTIDASRKSFRFYSNGVYDDPKCKTGANDTSELDHIVLAVGYGVMKNGGKPYWILKNSWSNYWGNDGYIFVNQDNDCGITTAPTYVVL